LPIILVIAFTPISRSSSKSICFIILLSRPICDLKVVSSRHAREKLGRDFDYERDLLGFEPERWLSEDQSSFDAYSLPRLSFSLGPRGCFGEWFCFPRLLFGG
jgi:hypothetical protein